MSVQTKAKPMSLGSLENMAQTGGDVRGIVFKTFCKFYKKMLQLHNIFLLHFFQNVPEVLWLTKTFCQIYVKKFSTSRSRKTYPNTNSVRYKTA